MFWKRKKEKDIELNLPEYLSKEEKRQIRALVRSMKRREKIPCTVQQSIPFERMFQNGICRVEKDYYTKTIQFQDINYQLAEQQDKTEIFEEWCSFLNFFDSSIHFELSFMNMTTDMEKFEQSISIAHRQDGYDEIRDEYSTMLFHQMQAGNNGLTKTKYLSFGIKASSIKRKVQKEGI